MSPDHGHEFDAMMHREFGPTTPDNAPYGTPAKTGLTPRGKAALALAGTVIAGGSLLGWQHYSAQQATAEAKAQEIALKQQELRLAELRELNKVNSAQAETRSAADQARQKNIDACVDGNKQMVGKMLGVTYRSVVEDCQAQYPATTHADMQAAAATTDTPGGGVNSGLLIGGGVLALGLAAAAMKSKKPTPA